MPDTLGLCGACTLHAAIVAWTSSMMQGWQFAGHAGMGVKAVPALELQEGQGEIHHKRFRLLNDLTGDTCTSEDKVLP